MKWHHNVRVSLASYLSRGGWSHGSWSHGSWSHGSWSHGKWSALVLGVALFAVVIAGCSTPAPSHKRSPDHVIGIPPSANEDPFFIQSMPSAAVPVAPSGEIADHEATTPQDSTAPEKRATPQDSTTPEKRTAPQDGTSTEARCFSCVRICPAKGDCDRAKKDVICGWGAHPEPSEAKRMAKAQCDGTLDMARQMPLWSEIGGECPAATCR